MDALVGDKLAMYETAGSLHGGKRVWMMASIPKEYRAGPDDLIKPYVLLTNTHDGSQYSNQPDFINILVDFGRGGGTLRWLIELLHTSFGSGVLSGKDCEQGVGPATLANGRKPLGEIGMKTSLNLRRFMIAFAAVCVPLAGVGAASAAITIATVPVGNIGNIADTSGHSGNSAGQGAVSYAYNIGKYDVTAGQYTAFRLSAKAADAGWQTTRCCGMRKSEELSF